VKQGERMRVPICKLILQKASLLTKVEKILDDVHRQTWTYVDNNYTVHQFIFFQITFWLKRRAVYPSSSLGEHRCLFASDETSRIVQQRAKTCTQPDTACPAQTHIDPKAAL